MEKEGALQQVSLLASHYPNGAALMEELELLSRLEHHMKHMWLNLPRQFSVGVGGDGGGGSYVMIFYFDPIAIITPGVN